MTDVRCKFRLPPGNLAGAVDVPTLKAWADKYPHLRPCKLERWGWVNKARCKECQYNLENQNADNDD